MKNKITGMKFLVICLSGKKSGKKQKIYIGKDQEFLVLQNVMNMIHNSLFLFFIVLTSILTFMNSHTDTAQYGEYMKKRAKDA